MAEGMAKKVRCGSQMVDAQIAREVHSAVTHMLRNTHGSADGERSALPRNTHGSADVHFLVTHMALQMAKEVHSSAGASFIDYILADHVALPPVFLPPCENTKRDCLI
eukprot:2906998-Rhodomonas_salina.1